MLLLEELRDVTKTSVHIYDVYDYKRDGCFKIIIGAIVCPDSGSPYVYSMFPSHIPTLTRRDGCAVTRIIGFVSAHTVLHKPVNTLVTHR